MSETLKRLFWTNPLRDEAVRAWRKFFRVAGGPGRWLRRMVVGLILLFYLWLLADTALDFHGDILPWVLMFQLFIVTLVMPMSIYGAISGEREKTTWEALVLTRLTPGQIVAGKIMWRIVSLLAIMALFLPPLLLGTIPSSLIVVNRDQYSTQGVALDELMTFCWGVGLSAFGLWISANTRRSVTSIGLILAALLLTLVLAPTLISMVSSQFIFGAGFDINFPVWLLTVAHPFYAMSMMIEGRHDYSVDGVSYASYGVGAPGVLQSAIYAIGAVVFLYATVRSLRIYEEPRRRLG